MLIEGESLLNDATATVMFIVFRDVLVGAKDSSAISVLNTAARMWLGGEYRRKEAVGHRSLSRESDGWLPCPPVAQDSPFDDFK